jgi:hypothetical protein
VGGRVDAMLKVVEFLNRYRLLQISVAHFGRDLMIEYQCTFQTPTIAETFLEYVGHNGLNA